MGALDEAKRLARAGRTDDAVALIEGAAEGGDAEAAFMLANWRLFGLYGPRNFAAVHRLLERAGEAGHKEAVRLRATLVGNGTGVQENEAAARAMLEGIRSVDPEAERQLSALDAIEDEPPPAAESLSEAPLVRAIRGFLSPMLCSYLIEAATPRLLPSTIVDPQTRRQVPHPFRTSSGTNFGPAEEDLVIRRINRRVAEATGTEPAWGEPLHILRYAPGQEYRPHLDALPGAANQRHWTMLIYLNEGYQGGATRFEETGLEFAGRTGDALIFRNVDEAGRPDQATRHTGLPVTGGTKWLATRWIRQAPHDPWSG